MIMISSPAFVFSRFPGVQEQDNMVSFPTFVRLSGGAIDSVDKIPLKEFLVKVSSDATDKEIDEIIKLLNDKIISQTELNVWDYREDVSYLSIYLHTYIHTYLSSYLSIFIHSLLSILLGKTHPNSFSCYGLFLLLYNGHCNGNIYIYIYIYYILMQRRDIV